MNHALQTTLFEPFEPRIVLSDSYYAWTDVTLLPGYDPQNADLRVGDAPIIGASDNGRFLWSSARPPSDGNKGWLPSWLPYLVADGEVVYTDRVPGLEAADLLWINSDGLAFGVGNAGDDDGRLFTLDLLGDRNRNYLDAAELVVPDDFDLALARPIAVSDSGALIVSTREGEGQMEVVWIIIDSQVFRLWDGGFVDVNDSNEVVGYSWSDDYRPDGEYADYEPLYWAPGAVEPVNLADQGVLGVADINDAGAVLIESGSVMVRGEAVPESIAVWDEGVVESLGYGYERVDTWRPEERWYRARGWDEEGKFLIEPFYYTPMNDYAGSLGYMNLVNPNGRTHLLSEPSYIGKSSRLRPSGAVVGPLAGWWSPIDPLELQSVRPNAPVLVWNDAGQLNAWSLSPSGRGLQLRLTDDGAASTLIHDLPGMRDPDSRREVLLQQNGGDVMIATFADDGVSCNRVGRDQSWGSASLRFVGDEYFHATAYGREDRALAFAYLNRAGELGVGWGGVTANLTRHFASWGLQMPAFAGELSAYSTRWHGQTIVGLDVNGDVQAAWWAPGLHSEYWTVSNLSEIAGAPPLVGRVVGGAMGDAGMVILGADAQGHLISLEWTADADVWTVTDLTAATGGPAITPDTLLVQSPWGRASVVARDISGDIITYWRTDDAWTAEPVNQAAGGDSPTITGPISYFVWLGGERYIGGSTEDGEVIVFSRLADDRPWQWQDLTALATV